jgi:hypothetical protein
LIKVVAQENRNVRDTCVHQKQLFDSAKTDTGILRCTRRDFSTDFDRKAVGHRGGRLPTYLYQLVKTGNSSELTLNPEFKSVIVVRGSFDKKTGENPPIDSSSSVAALRAGGILVRELAFVYEAQIEIAEDSTALRYESRYVEVNSFINAGGKKSKPKERRTVVLSLTISGVGQKEGEPVLSLAMINLGEVNGGAILEPEDLISRQSSWLGGLAISERSMKAIENMKPLGNSINVMPITIEATIAETETGNAALKFIGEVLDAAKTDVAKTGSSEILDRDKKEDAAATALEKLLKEEETAFAALLNAELEFAKLPPLSNPATEGEKKTLLVKKFAIESAGRAWCVKFGALQQLGKAPNRPGHTCPVVLP